MSLSIKYNGCIRFGIDNVFLYEGNVRMDEDGAEAPDGHGVLSQPGSVYSGQFKDGKKCGFGKLELIDSNFVQTIILGSFGTGRQHAIIKYKASEYKGSILDNMPHGHGITTYRNGDEYKGGFQTGREHGFGSRIWKGKGTYSGRWYQGIPDNSSLELRFFWSIFPDRKIQVTPCEEKNGKFLYANGDYYEGTFKNNEFDGLGKVFFAKENITLQGPFVKGSLNGKGTLTFSNGRYVGDFLNGVATGHGRLEYDNGNYYEGTFNSGLPVEGKMHWKNVGEYMGVWDNGIPNVPCEFI